MRWEMEMEMEMEVKSRVRCGYLADTSGLLAEYKVL